MTVRGRTGGGSGRGRAAATPLAARWRRRGRRGRARGDRRDFSKGFSKNSNIYKTAKGLSVIDLNFSNQSEYIAIFFEFGQKPARSLTH